MASTYPTSLDAFTNPTTTDPQNNPSHAGQHSDANDAIEALEAKLGIGASPAASATEGQVLTRQGDGTTAWQSATSESLDSTKAAATDDIINSDVTGDTNDRFVVDADGRHHWGPGNGATDVNLYRVSASILGTSNRFDSANQIIAWSGAANRVTVGVGPAGVAGIALGSAGDVNLYRAAADTLKTDDVLQSASRIDAYSGAAAEVRMGAQGPSGEAGLQFGSALDTNLYRSAANTLRTDDALIVAGSNGLTVSEKVEGKRVNVVGTAGDGYLWFTAEQSADPAAPSADQARIFIKDNGAGKTQLCVRFATGATQVIATEP